MSSRSWNPPRRLGFWHVRTADAVEGWVYQTLVHVEEVGLVRLR